MAKKEAVIDSISSSNGQKDLVLTKKEVVLKAPPNIRYEHDVGQIRMKDILYAAVQEMSFSPAFAFSWIGVELALLLVFFGLTRLSIPLFNIFVLYTQTKTVGNFLSSLTHPLVASSVINSLISLVLIASGVLLVPMFDDVMIRIVAKDGSMIRYMKNYRFKDELENFRASVEKLKSR